MRNRTLIAALLVTALMAVGCGGDDEGGGDEVSDDAFVAEITRVCEAAIADAPELGLIGDQTEKSAAEYYDEQIIPALEKLNSDLADITPPPEKADDYERLLDLNQQQTDLIAEDPLAHYEAQTAGGPLPPELEALNPEITELTSSLGFPESCGG